MQTPSPEIDFDRIYKLTDEGDRRALIVEPCDKSIDYFALLQSRIELSEPLEFRRALGRIPRDLVLGTSVALHLLSPRTLDVLNHAAVSGWTTFPADAHGANGIRLDGYAGLVVTGRCGPIENARSGRVLLPPPSPQGRTVAGWRGLYFDPGTWDGSDIFSVEGTAYVFVVERVKDVIERSQLTNFAFRPLTSIERIML